MCSQQSMGMVLMDNNYSMRVAAVNFVIFLKEDLLSLIVLTLSLQVFWNLLDWNCTSSELQLLIYCGRTIFKRDACTCTVVSNGKLAVKFGMTCSCWHYLLIHVCSHSQFIFWTSMNTSLTCTCSFHQLSFSFQQNLYFHHQQECYGTEQIACSNTQFACSSVLLVRESFLLTRCNCHDPQHKCYCEWEHPQAQTPTQLSQ